jgi:GNAT superfamily N-acetyltransferase
VSERPLRPTIDLRETTPDDDGAVTALMTAYLMWAHRILRDEYGVDKPPTDAAQVRESLHALLRPSAMILLAEREGDAIGVGAVRGLDTDVAEIKRMYVDPGARGLHVGAAVLDRLLDESRRAGAKIVRLDTCEFMTDAQRLYRSRGFVERSPYEGTEIPERLQKSWLFFEREMRPH